MADITQVTAVDNPTETSTTYVRIADMVIVTPDAGEYFVLFTSSAQNNSSGNPVGSYIITVGGTEQTHTERQEVFEESSSNAAYAICTSGIVTVNGSQDIEIKQKISSDTVTMHQRALTIVGPIDAADTFQATGTTNDTSATSSPTRIDDMVLTPGAGDYLAVFSGSFTSSTVSGDELGVSVYVNGSVVPHTVRHVEMEGSMSGGNRFIVLIAAKVSPGAAEDVEVMWERLSGTATWTAYNRTLSLIKTETADIKEVSATGDHADSATSDEVIDGMTLVDPGVGDWLVIFSSSWTFGTIGANVTVTSSLYNAGSQVSASERIPVMDSSIDNCSCPWGMHGGKVVVAGGTDDVDARWRGSLSDSRTIHQRTLVALRPTPGTDPTITDVEGDEEYDDDDTALTITGTNYEASKGSGKVEMGDDPDYATAVKVEQTTTSWGATSIDFTADLGTQSPGAKWLFVTNDTGDKNDPGFAVTVHRAHELRMIASANIDPSGEATTQAGGGMTPPSGKSSGDFDAGRIQDDENPADTVDITLDDYTEMEWCFELKSNAPSAQAYLFRVTKNGTVIDTYTVTPQITVSAGVTLTPSPVVMTFIAATPTLVAGVATLTPSAVVATFAIAAPTLVAGVVTLTPSPVVATFSISAPTLVVGTVTLTPASVVATFTIPAPTLVAGVATLTPAAVSASFVVPAPTVTNAIVLTPSAVVVEFVVPAPTLVAGVATLTPSPVVATFAIPAPTVVAGVATLTPAAVVTTFVVPAPTVVSVSTITPSPVVATFAIPAPTLVAGVATLTPSPVVTTFAVPAPTLVAGAVTLTPSAAVATFVIPAPAVTNAQVATPSAVVATFVVPAPTVAAGVATLTPSAVVIRFAVATPTVVIGTVTLTPSSVVATFSVPAPTLVVGVATLTPSPVVVSFAVPAPTLVAGAVTLAPSAVVATFSIPAPVVVVGGLLSPSPIVATFLVATPTVVGGAVTISPAAAVMRFLLPAPTVSVPGADDLASHYMASGGSNQFPLLNSIVRGRR